MAVPAPPQIAGHLCQAAPPHPAPCCPGVTLPTAPGPLAVNVAFQRLDNAPRCPGSRCTAGRSLTDTALPARPHPPRAHRRPCTLASLWTLPSVGGSWKHGDVAVPTLSCPALPLRMGPMCQLSAAWCATATCWALQAQPLSPSLGVTLSPEGLSPAHPSHQVVGNRCPLLGLSGGCTLWRIPLTRPGLLSASPALREQLSVGGRCQSSSPSPDHPA